jgi:acetoin dehydrogenase acuC
MNTRPLVLHDDTLERYSFGPEHPMGPDRVRLAMKLSEHFHLLDRVDIAPAPAASEDLLLRIHTPEYLEALKEGRPRPEFGIGDDDHPLAPNLHTIARHVVSGTVEATRAVWEGEVKRAVNLSGGLHHAGPSKQSGFCTFNDAAVAISWLLDHGATRIAYVDLDAHHGDGVEQAFWDDPRVLTISVHESGLYLFPGTGFANDIGGPHAAGTAVNVALPKGTSDIDWLYAVHGIVPPLLQKFRPEIVITQHGADAHRRDPLTDLDVSVDALAKAYRSMSRWADRFCGGKWVAIGGGGYQRDSVARTWTHLVAAILGEKLDPEAPMPGWWADEARCETSDTIGDIGARNVLKEYHPERVLNDNPCGPIVATSRAIFPYWGLVPYH